MDRSRPSRRLGHRRPRVRPGEPVNMGAGPQDVRPQAAGRRVMSPGVGITPIAVGAILWFAPGSRAPAGGRLGSPRVAVRGLGGVTGLFPGGKAVGGGEAGGAA